MLDYSTFSELYRRYHQSGLKVRDFCHNEGIHETTFYYWMRKCKKRQIPSPSSGDFVPMLIENAPASPVLTGNTSTGSTSQITTCEIALPTGAFGVGRQRYHLANKNATTFLCSFRSRLFRE